jgi:hypothetical protein
LARQLGRRDCRTPPILDINPKIVNRPDYLVTSEILCQARKGYSACGCQAHNGESQRTAAIMSLVMAFEVVKATQTDGLDWGDGYRPLARTLPTLQPSY